MTRDEIIEAIRTADTRIQDLLPLARAHPDASLPTGEWRVRDALSHIAARGNPIPLLMRYLNESTDDSGTPRPMPIRDIHEINAEQVHTRADQDVDTLIEEMRDGHQAALDALNEIEDAVLERRLTVAFPPGELSVGEFIVLAGTRHESNHLDEIESALKQPA